MHNVEKFRNILLRILRYEHSKFLKYIWPFFNIIHEWVKGNTKIIIKTTAKPPEIILLMLSVHMKDKNIEIPVPCYTIECGNTA